MYKALAKQNEEEKKLSDPNSLAIAPDSGYNNNTMNFNQIKMVGYTGL